MRNEIPHTLQVEKVINEAEGIKSLFFRAKIPAKPGQFVMVWVPGLDAKPFGVSYLTGRSFGITVCDVGAASSAMCKSKKGDFLGIMGPYGNAFNLKGNRIILVAGGYGAGPLFLLSEEAKMKGVTTTFVIGARTKRLLLYRERAKKECINAIFTTDDGSFGRKGFTTDVLEESLKAGGIDAVYGCGPEMMLKKIAELCHRYRVKCELSVERYMKCGFGICGSCCIDDKGFPLCIKGTVVTGKEAMQLKEFGSYHRDASGARRYFER